jgi:hypothetical protein
VWEKLVKKMKRHCASKRGTKWEKAVIWSGTPAACLNPSGGLTISRGAPTIPVHPVFDISVIVSSKNIVLEYEHSRIPGGP